MLLDIEINLNNLPLTFFEDNVQLNVLSPKSMILGRDVSKINSIANDDSDEWII